MKVVGATVEGSPLADFACSPKLGTPIARSILSQLPRLLDDGLAHRRHDTAVVNDAVLAL